MREARERANQIIDQAQHRANELVEQAKGTATQRRRSASWPRRSSRSSSRPRSARESLRREVASIAVSAASKLLEREIDPRTHADLLDKLATQI